MLLDQPNVCFSGKNGILKKNYFFIFLNRFNMLILKENIISNKIIK